MAVAMPDDQHRVTALFHYISATDGTSTDHGNEAMPLVPGGYARPRDQRHLV